MLTKIKKFIKDKKDKEIIIQKTILQCLDNQEVKITSVFLKRLVNRSLGYEISLGHFFIEMEKFLENGWVEKTYSEKVFPERGNRYQVYYKITQPGKEKLNIM